MPAPNKRSRSLRKIYVKTPGGKAVIHYKLRKPKAAHCVKCGAVLKGIARGRPCKMRTIAKSKKTVNRPYGGNLCSQCMREMFVSKARV